MAQPKNPSSLEESPLLGNRSAVTSTINPNKLDHARFTEINNVSGGDNSSPIKVILFLLIIIFVAVIAAILVRNSAANQNTDTNSPVSTPVVTNTPTSALTIASNALSDAAATNLASNNDYVDSAQVSLGTSTSTAANTSLTSVEYNKYLSFSRLTFTFDTSDNKLPKTNITFDSAGKKMTLAFTNLVAANIPAELQKDNPLGGIVVDMKYITTNSNYVLSFSDSLKYRVLAVDNKLILDFKTLTVLAAATPTPSVTTTPKASVTPTVADSSKPAAPHYENDFSQSKQYISSSLNTNTIEHNVYYVDNFVDRFEYSWGEKNKVGDAYIPNAIAYYDTSAPSGSVYLNVEISNLSKEILSQNGKDSQTAEEIQTKTGVNTSGINLKKVTLLSFENGVAKYQFELKKKADFRLYVQKTVDNATQVLTIAIMN